MIVSESQGKQPCPFDLPETEPVIVALLTVAVPVNALPQMSPPLLSLDHVISIVLPRINPCTPPVSTPSRKLIRWAA